MPFTRVWRASRNNRDPKSHRTVAKPVVSRDDGCATIARPWCKRGQTIVEARIYSRLAASMEKFERCAATEEREYSRFPCLHLGQRFSIPEKRTVILWWYAKDLRLRLIAQGSFMTPESVHALKGRIWKQPPLHRAEYLSDLDAAVALSAGEEQDAALAKITKRVVRAEALNDRNMTRKEAAAKAAADKLRQEIGF